MKIVFICAVFPPEPSPAGVMAHQLATRLVRNGHDVTMIVPFPNRPEGILYPGFRRRLRSRTVVREGYTLVRCANWLLGKQRKNVNRMLENITFGISSAWAASRERCPDVMITETWPLFATLFCTSLARWRGIPYLYYVQDVYPEAAEGAGIIRSKGIVARACRLWDRYLCSHSAQVIVISETMRDLLAANRNLALERLTVIPNWIDEATFGVLKTESTWRSTQGIPNDVFVASFSGTLGYVSGVEVLVDVAQIMQSETEVILLCIGEGGRKQAMVDDASRLGLTNIRFLPFQPVEQVPEAQSSCDVALLTMHPDSSDSSVPSKLITYFAASLPVICAAKAESAVARTVRDAAAGIVVCPGNPQAIADAILQLKSEPETVHRMGRNARLYFEKHYTLERAYSQFSKLLQEKGRSRRE
jgi:colanic acid biosynthesis glycosyl transferase WcaI